MNYHNFASRLSLPRVPSANSPKEQPKAAPKKSPRTPRRRLATATAVALWCLCAFHADAEAKTDGAHASRPPVRPINTPTFIITLTGLAVVVLRLPTLWRRDLDC
ncbi:MAG: hypothetical protein WDN28_09235 [Chthoniobacter sp.]